MSGRFYDHCDRSDCMFNKFDKSIRVRKCECLVNTDFGGSQGGEKCPFYRKRKQKEKSR